MWSGIIWESVRGRFFSRVHDLTSPATGGWWGIQFQEGTTSCWVGLKPTNATSACLEIACHAGGYGSQGLLLGKTIICISPWQQHSTFSYYQANLKGPYATSSWAVLSPLSEVSGLWQYSLTFKFQETRVTTIAYIVYGISWITLTNNLKGGFPCLALGLC